MRAVNLREGGLGVFVAIALATPVAGPARAAEAASELDALELADRTPEAKAPQGERSWRSFVELGYGRSTRTSPELGAGTARAALDLRYDGRPAPGLRAVVSNRLDLAHRSGQTDDDVNTLREAYLAWSASESQTLEFGRINVRQGVAMGYNPTDYFRGDAVRLQVSPDPALLRENRQGTVALQWQQLWDSGSLALTASPKLGDGPDADGYSLNFGATNPRWRWQALLGQRVAAGVTPQLVLHGGDDVPLQAGLNLAASVGGSTVAFVELSGGRGRSLRADALGLDEARRGQGRAALGLTYTTPFDLNVTVEAEANAAGLREAEWAALTDLQRLQVLSRADAAQEIVARRAWFLHLRWSNLLTSGLDLSAYLRQETETSSRDQWIELRYRLSDAQTVALQWQVYSGRTGSIYGSVPRQRAAEASWQYFF